MQFCGREEKFQFKIWGVNPSDQTVKDYISAREPKMWYNLPVALQESVTTLNQFDPEPKLVDIGKPLENKRKKGADGDGGIGIYQLTANIKYPNDLWKWTQNVSGGIRRLSELRGVGVDFMNRQRGQALNEWGRTCLDSEDIIPPGHAVPIPDRQEGTAERHVIFSETMAGARPFEDAIAVKAYNGANHHYCAWIQEDPPPPANRQPPYPPLGTPLPQGITAGYWRFLDERHYVADVCARVGQSIPAP